MYYVKILIRKVFFYIMYIIYIVYSSVPTNVQLELACLHTHTCCAASMLIYKAMNPTPPNTL